MKVTGPTWISKVNRSGFLNQLYIRPYPCFTFNPMGNLTKQRNYRPKTFVKEAIRLFGKYQKCLTKSIKQDQKYRKSFDFSLENASIDVPITFYVLALVLDQMFVFFNTPFPFYASQCLSQKRHEFFTINHVLVLATEKMKTSTMYYSSVFCKIFCKNDSREWVRETEITGRNFLKAYAHYWRISTSLFGIGVFS